MTPEQIKRARRVYDQCLILAERTNVPGERDAALQKATEIHAKYGFGAATSSQSVQVDDFYTVKAREEQARKDWHVAQAKEEEILWALWEERNPTIARTAERNPNLTNADIARFAAAAHEETNQMAKDLGLL